jgi:hypothetical protein
MTKIFKIIVTIVFCLMWGQIQHGFQQGVRSTGSGLGFALVNIFGLALLVAGIYRIWKYNPKKSSDNDNPKLDKS